ncbi:serine-rich glycoprotein adhesin, partial [Limosilactobacillus reuteri]|uniref:serine-rich glycoprotein adhesin n=1 Tax=Limosilactobacillus reuteri TaxID=1598 RepID=UPI001E5DEA11
MSKHKNEQENGSKVKLYKTKHGWFSALTRFFKLFSFRSKKEVKPTNFNDLDSLKDKHDSAMPDAYKKGAATMATLLGAGVIGTTSPTEAHAATTTVDQNSHVVGSGSTSTSTSTSQMTGSTSTSTSTTTGSTSTSTVSSTSSSTSTTTSTTGSTSTSQSTGSTSASNSTSITSGSGSTSTSNSNSTSFASASTSISNSTLSVLDNNAVANSVTQSLKTTTNTANLTNAALASAYQTNLIQVQNRTVSTTNENDTVQTEDIQADATASNADELKKALLDTSVHTIKLTNNITLTSAIELNNVSRDVTIYGNGKYINAANTGDGGIFIDNNNTSYTVNLTIENATLYNQSQYGFVHMNNWGTDNITYKNVTAYGGTLVWSQSHRGEKTLTLAGTTTLHSVSSYQVNNQSYSTQSFTMGTHQPNGYTSSAIYMANAVNIADNANVTIDNHATNIDIRVIPDDINITNEAAVTVGKNATLTMDNGNNTAFNIKMDGTKSNSFTVGEGSTVKLSAKVDNVRILPYEKSNTANVSFAKGSDVTLHAGTGSNLRMGASISNQIDFNGKATFIKDSGAYANTAYADQTRGNIEFDYYWNDQQKTGSTGVANFNPGSNVSFQAGPGASNVNTYKLDKNHSYIRTTVNINNPERVTFDTDIIQNNKGVAYLGNADNGIVVNVNNASVKVNDNNFSDVISSNTTTITGSTVNVGSVSMASTNDSFTNASTSLSGSVSFSYATSMATSQLNAVDTNSTSTVVYQGSTVISQSTSTSVEQSQSVSTEQSQSASTSESIVQSQSRSTSTSESLSGSISESIANSQSASTSAKESLSNSVSMSESMSGSVSMSESLSNSVSMSESLSGSVSMSESMSNSVSMSESLSNSVSMSESLSNSVSMSESLSNSVSMSESLSNSVSMSESLSNSVSMSESLSNSVSMSESLSNSVSMSESLSNSVSMSESLSNSVSMSESLSNSVSMSESLSNSVSMSESLSNSVSMSESLSNSVSMSESLSNSVSMSESLSNSVSMSESLSNSVSMSESLSNSVSMSESLSNSV